MKVKARFDAVVVGSGFGGSVCAARLAQRGMRVLILERGPWWGPLQRDRPNAMWRNFPRGVRGSRKLLRNVRVARRGGRTEWLVHSDGLLEAHVFEHLNALTASGVGGGSHVYTGILEQPASQFFDAYPEEISGPGLRPYFERVRSMLRPTPVPSAPARTRVFTEAVASAGFGRTEYPDLAVDWERVAGATEEGQYRSDALVGCDDGSKVTLDLSYLPLALEGGAELRPLSEVLAVGAERRGYWVEYRDHQRGSQRRESAPRLILAAGGLNTQRLLFHARDGHGSLPKLSAMLGRHFSSNGDMAALIYDSPRLEDASLGPAVGAIARVSGAATFIIGEIGLPVNALPLPGTIANRLRRSTVLFCMGRDASAGTLGFDGTGLTLYHGRQTDRALYQRMEAALRSVARHYAPRRLVTNLLTGAGPSGLATVHPLGGCSMGQTEREGVTDHRGEVFGHPGLFIADGSLYPAAPGIAPSMTIAALAERQAALMD